MIRAVCLLLGHRFEDVGEPREAMTTAPYPAVAELEQPQQCLRCHKWRTRYAGFIWGKRK